MGCWKVKWGTGAGLDKKNVGGNVELLCVWGLTRRDWGGKALRDPSNTSSFGRFA